MKVKVSDKQNIFSSISVLCETKYYAILYINLNKKRLDINQLIYNEKHSCIVTFGEDEETENPPEIEFYDIKFVPHRVLYNVSKYNCFICLMSFDFISETIPNNMIWWQDIELQSPDNETLKKYAEKNSPPQEWYEETDNLFSN